MRFFDHNIIALLRFQVQWRFSSLFSGPAIFRMRPTPQEDDEREEAASAEHDFLTDWRKEANLRISTLRCSYHLNWLAQVERTLLTSIMSGEFVYRYAITGLYLDL